jgi:hypothetical protein
MYRIFRITRESKQLSALLVFQFIYTKVGVEHSLLPFRCTWSSGPQACVFPPRRFSVGRATIYAPHPASAFGAKCWLQIVDQQITVAWTVDRTPRFQ